MAKVRKTKTDSTDDRRSEDTPEKPSKLARARRGAIAFLFQPKRLAIAAIAPAMLLLVPGLLAALPDVADQPEYQLTGRDIRVVPVPPPIVPHDLLERVLGTEAMNEKFSVLDSSLAPRLTDAFERHPWIASVEQIRKDFPPAIQVEVQYRRPVAMIEGSEGLYPVDGEAIVLPTKDFELSIARRFPLVRGVESQPGGPAGSDWGDPAVVGAARIAAALGPKWDGLKLTAIIAPRPLSEKDRLVDLHYELSTSGGSRILWGRAPESGHPGELTVGQKIGRLEKYLSDFGGYDKPAGPYEIDIRHWQEMTRRPLMTRP